MTEPDGDRDPVEALAAEFMERRRQGEYPSISEYVTRYPELASEIQDLFPAVALIEQLKLEKEQSDGPRAVLGKLGLERLGDFRILGEIGRGGMGIVYEAFQESLGRHVAVKVLPRQALLDAKQLQRFQREAQTAARLHHTNIVPLFGVGEQEGFHYIVMQLIRGVGLDAVLASLQQFGDSTACAPLGQDSSSLPPSSDEAMRLAVALVEGHFERAGEFGPASGGSATEPIAPPQAGETFAESIELQVDGGTGATAGLPSSAEKTRADKPPVAPSRCTNDLRLNQPFTSPSPSPVDSRNNSVPRRLGPSYWRSVAAIGRQVADALHYAHVHQTLHRDIKPANLLLDSQGVVWITDFGLAKALDDAALSQAGTVAGTLRYMAPEQFAGHLDCRSDIYSLGLTLYELVTLQPAFADTRRSNLIRRISHDEPTRPRKFNPSIPRDLETIVLKAMARDPADRYQTAGALARDLECFLEDRPILARRFSPIERLWRWSRRNRALASLAASTLVLLVLVAVVASWGYVRTTQANVEEARQRKRAENTSALALEALDNIFQQFAPDRTAPASTLLVVGEEGEEVTVPVQPALSKETAALLEHMLAFYDRLAAQGGDDVQLHHKVAEANRRVGDIRQRLGQYEESKAAYLRAIELYSTLADTPQQAAEFRTELARLQNELGNVYSAMDDWKEGDAAYRKALAALDAAPAESASSPQHQYELARTYYFLGRHPLRQMIPPPADGRRGPRPGPLGFTFDPRGPHRQGPGLRGGKHGPPSDSPDSPPDRPERAEDPLPQGPFDPGDGLPPDPGDGLPPDLGDGLPPDFGDGLPPDRFGGPPPDLADGPPPDLTGSLPPDLGDVPPPDLAGGPPPDLADGLPPRTLFDRGDREEMLQKAITILEDLVTKYPKVPDYRYLLARCYRETRPLRLARNSEGATDDSRKATEILQKLVEEYPDVPDYRYDLSETYAMLDARGPFAPESTDPAQERRSRESLEKALAISEGLVAEHPNIPDYMASQVHIRMRLTDLVWQSDPSRAETNLRKARDLEAALVRDFPENSSYKLWTAVIDESLGRLLQERKQFPEARTTLQEGINLLKEVVESDPKKRHIRWVLAENYRNLADLLRSMDDTEAAAEADRQAEELRKTDEGAGPPLRRDHRD